MGEVAVLRKPQAAKPLKLHIGCGGNKLPEYVNCDYHELASGADVRFDATKPWPFANNSVSEVLSSHFIEHLDDPRAFFKQAWNAMHDNAQMTVRAPYGNHHYAWVDITHVRPWFPGSFCFLQPNYIKESRNPQHEWTHFFGIHSVELRVAEKFHKFMHWPFESTFLSWVDHLNDSIIELQAQLYAIKSNYTMDYFLRKRRGNEVTVLYVKEFSH